ncbi:MAG: hypothetical protein LH624_03250 [Cryobacterium sp.]|nr:hypothetical protein [Cryobacterium sp.]
MPETDDRTVAENLAQARQDLAATDTIIPPWHALDADAREAAVGEALTYLRAARSIGLTR